MIMLGGFAASHRGFLGVKKDDFSMKNHLFSPLIPFWSSHRRWRDLLYNQIGKPTYFLLSNRFQLNERNIFKVPILFYTFFFLPIDFSFQ